MNDDWQGADFIAQHVEGESFLKVQLKSRLCIDRAYRGKDLHIAFPYEGRWFVYPHDELVEYFETKTNVCNTDSWLKAGNYSFNVLSRELLTHLEQYELRKETNDPLERS